MSKLVEVAMGRSDSLNSVTLLSLRSGKETDNRGDSITVRVLTRNIEGDLLAVCNKTETWQILARTLAIRLLYFSDRGCCISLLI